MVFQENTAFNKQYYEIKLFFLPDISIYFS